MDKRNTIMKTIILFKNNNLATMLYAAKLSNFSCVYSLVRHKLNSTRQYLLT